jgi:DNA-binding GntR family transcriptional regulator
VLLEENVLLAEEQFQRGLFSEKSDTNIEFHNILARTTRNPVLVTMVAMLNEVVRGFSRRLGLETTRRTFDSRHRMLRAMRRRNADLAVKEMLANLKKTHEAYVALARSGKQLDARKAQAKTKGRAST